MPRVKERLLEVLATRRSARHACDRDRALNFELHRLVSGIVKRPKGIGPGLLQSDCNDG